jgi:hypothetical protein
MGFLRTVDFARAYSAGHFELKIDGMPQSAHIKSIEGGWPKQNVSDEPVGGEIQRIKHGTTVEIEPIQLEVGMAQTDFLLKWIHDSWDRRFARHDGSLIHGDFNYKNVFQHDFYQALIEETTFPALDASSKDAAYLKVKLRPEMVDLKEGDGSDLVGNHKGKQKLWTCSSFRMSLDNGVDLSKVNKIDSFTIKQGVKPVNAGPMRMAELEPTKVDFPNLKLTVSMAYAQSLFDWYKRVVIDGQDDETSETTGSIEFLDNSRTKVLFRIDLSGVGIQSFNLPKSEANQDAIKRCAIELYVTEMQIGGDVRFGLE